MSKNNSEGIQSYPHDDSRTASEIVESFVESADTPEKHAEEFTELVEGIAQTTDERMQTIEEQVQAIEEKYKKQINLLEDEIELLQENRVRTVALKRVLLEYGMSSEQVEELVETVEAVDDKLGSDDDE